MSPSLLFHFYKDEDPLFLCLAITASFPSVGCRRKTLPHTKPGRELAKDRGGVVLLRHFQGLAIHNALTTMVLALMLFCLQGCLQEAGLLYSSLGWIQKEEGYSVIILTSFQSYLHCLTSFRNKL